MPWNLVAPAYADELVPVFEHFATEALRLAAPPAGSRVIDVACGPGTLSAVAARAGFVVDAIDFSPVMIERLAARGLANVTSRIADGQALPFPDGAFAAGFSLLGLMFFPDRAKGFAELRRVLAPGARAVISTWSPLADAPTLAAMFGALRDAMGPRAPESADLPLSTEDACRAEMGAAFTDVVVHRVPHIQHFASADELWSGLERTMAPLVMMRTQLGERWAPLATAARGALRDAVGSGSADLAMTALITVGTR